MHKSRSVSTSELTRRNFLKVSGTFLAGAVAFRPNLKQILPAKRRAQVTEVEVMGVLTDTTKCIGCRSCELACNKANNLPTPDKPFFDTSVFDSTRRPTTKAFTVVNRYTQANGDAPIYRKIQCMHCNEPACVSACPVAAMVKTPEGPVLWDERVCIGCRYCMTACPFSMPAYTYSSAFSPGIRKCTMCYARVFKKGGVPACVQSCPTGALTFGSRKELLAIAKKRIADNPDKYFPYIYGEQEAGGTSWLYLSSVPFGQLGFPAVEKEPYGNFTWNFLTAVPVVLILWPLFLIGLHRFGRRREQLAAEKALQQKENHIKGGDDHGNQHS